MTLACESASAAVVATLLGRLSDDQAATAILAENKDGANALMRAFRYASDPAAVVATLLGRLKADQAATAILAKNKDGSNALMLACKFTPAAVEPLLQCLADQAATAILARNKDGDNSLKIVYDIEKNNVDKIENDHSNALRLLIKALQAMENYFEVISQNVDPAIMQYLLEQNYIVKLNTPPNDSNPSPILQSAAPDGFFSENAAQENVTKKPKITNNDDDSENESECNDSEPDQKKRKSRSR